MLGVPTPFLLYAKLAVFAGALALVGFGAWHFRGLAAQREKERAVSEAVKGIQEKLDIEQKARAIAEMKADDQLDAFLKSIADLKAKNAVISSSITHERMSTPKFYSQPLPQGGYAQWLAARNLVKAPILSTTPTTTAPAASSTIRSTTE